MSADGFLSQYQFDALGLPIIITSAMAVTMPIKVKRDPGRNRPCPCGKPVKFKHCHGRGK